VSHLFAFVCAIPLGIVLGLAADGVRAKVGAAVFAGSVVTMFGLSALYHRVTWTPARRLWARRLDHLGIFGLIAGSYTPVGLLVLGGDWRIVILSIVWAGTFAAVVIKCWWPNGPKWLAALVGIGLGWVGVVMFPQLLDKTGTLSSLLILGGGLCYSIGAVIYALRKPDPFPAVFGYHEVFHALVIAAVALQYSAIAFFVVPR
jgi:hemolysin III